MRHEELALTAHEVTQENAELYSQIDSLRESLAAAERERDAAMEKAESLEIHVQSNYRLAAERDEAVKRAEAAEEDAERLRGSEKELLRGKSQYRDLFIKAESREKVLRAFTLSIEAKRPEQATNNCWYCGRFTPDYSDHAEECVYRRAQDALADAALASLSPAPEAQTSQEDNT
jgi:hypothetical protein